MINRGVNDDSTMMENIINPLQGFDEYVLLYYSTNMLPLQGKRKCFAKTLLDLYMIYSGSKFRQRRRR
jgi:hypothetical protein